MTNKPENKEEECPNCDVHSHCSLHDPELFEDMMDTLQTPEIELNQFNEKLVTRAREAGFTDKQITFLTETFEFIKEV